MITLDDARAAHALISPYVRVTPTSLWSPRVLLKHEYMQLSGTFKARGAYARQLGALSSGELNPRVGVVVASGGNAGLAHALVARELGHPAEVFVPGAASEAKVKRLRDAGATVHQVGRIYDDAFAASQERVAQTGAVYCHAYDQPEIVAGAGSVALELQEQAPEVDTVIVSVGGGGLLGGLLAGLRPETKVVAVETEGCPTLHSALAAGELVDVEVGGVAADSLGATRLGALGWELAEAASGMGTLGAIDTGATMPGGHEPGVAGRGSARLRSVLVSDAAVLEAQAALWNGHRVITEPAAATALAALTSRAYVPAASETVAVILCGANTAPGLVG